ncbi:MAG: rod shape-determining protein RodA [Bacteroidota bacterium]
MYRKLDWMLLCSWLGLVVIGLISIYSSTFGPSREFLLDSVQENFQKQLLWLVVSTVAMGITLTLPVRFLRAIAYPAYVVSLLLLVAALLFGREINGATSWLHIGPASIQVAEVAKVGTVMAVARLLSGRRSGENVRYALFTIVLVMLPATLILMQNDTGTMLVFLGLIPVLLFWSGIPVSIVSLLIAPAVVGYFAIVYMPLAIAFAAIFTLGMYWFTKDRKLTGVMGVFTGGTALVAAIAITSILAPHQIDRIKSFTNPEADEYRQGVGFHLVQSKAAIGSGGVFGQGFMQGPQTQGQYIPEQSTDFVFSIVGEEFGLVGGIAVLVLFGIMLLRLTSITMEVKHQFPTMIAVGATGIYLIHVFVNMGMVMGILPVIGIPLTFVSYGGSALLANSVLLALALNLHMRRDDFSIYGY